MYPYLRKFLLAFLVVWLPLQAVAASGVSPCQHSAPTSVAPDEAAMATPCHGAHDAGMQQNDHSTTQTAGNCDHCQLCSAIALPTSAFTPPTVAVAHFGATDAPAVLRFLPEQPQKPPLTSLT